MSNLTSRLAAITLTETMILRRRRRRRTKTTRTHWWRSSLTSSWTRRSRRNSSILLSRTRGSILLKELLEVTSDKIVMWISYSKLKCYKIPTLGQFTVFWKNFKNWLPSPNPNQLPQLRIFFFCLTFFIW